jgi:hypothetical protein
MTDLRILIMSKLQILNSLDFNKFFIKLDALISHWKIKYLLFYFAIKIKKNSDKYIYCGRKSLFPNPYLFPE